MTKARRHAEILKVPTMVEMIEDLYDEGISPVVFEQEVVVCDVGDDVAGKYVFPPAIRRADSTGSGVKYLGYFLHHVMDYGRGHGFGGVGYIQWLTSCTHHTSPWMLVNVGVKLSLSHATE